MNQKEIEKLWMCPNCGEKNFIVCAESKFVRTGEEDLEDYYMSVPKKIWCMKCQKEYPVNAVIDKEVVQFT